MRVGRKHRIHNKHRGESATDGLGAVLRELGRHRRRGAAAYESAVSASMTDLPETKRLADSIAVLFRWLHTLRLGAKEIEIAALVGLQDLTMVEVCIAASRCRGWLCRFRPAALEFGIRHQ